jgi:hypothetical protein
VLSGERGEYAILTGDSRTAGALAGAVNAQSSGVGLVPEQIWDAPDVAASAYGSDPTTASIGFTNGKPDGSAAPLTWGAASQVRLVADLTAGQVLETPGVTTDRYLRHTQGSTTLTVTAPADGSLLTGTVDVTGTAAPGATVDVAAVGVDNNSITKHVSAVVGAAGTFTLPVSLVNGSNALVVTSTTPAGATAQTVRSVYQDAVAGTLIYDRTDPSGDDNGPGNYAYPTSDNFHAGAYDLTDFQIYDTGDTITFRVQTGDLTPTFGSPLGAQLVDLYVHQPNAASTSTAASFPTRNYTIAAADAWDRLIEVQGFGQRFVDASNTNTVGTVTISANAISRYITFSVTKAALGGTPGSGWSFTLTLTGQDGFSSDQARGFAPTPADFTFGVCATASSDPKCTFNPNAVPKVMDTIPPTGTDQSSELDYTAGPVVLQGLTLP